MDALGGVAFYGIVQRRSQDAVRGRVFAALAMAGLMANTVGFVIVGPLVEWLGPKAVYALGGVVMVIATFSFWLPTSAGRFRTAAAPDET
jgi:Na+/melibiose symporter-like transporter